MQQEKRKITGTAVPQPDVRTQVGAICYRLSNSKPEILLITSRGTGRWVIPKGWPMTGKTPAEAAAQEAWEEAGVSGRVAKASAGQFNYTKVVINGDDFPCQVMLFPLRVKSLARSYPEQQERRRKWFTPKKAAQRVAEPELADVLRAFDPDALT